MKKIAVFAVLLALLTGCAVNNPRSYERRTRIVDVNNYELTRNKLYDAALNFVLVVKNCYDNDVNNDWLDISEYNREIISTYRVPNLGVLLDAMEQLEMRESVELADAYDDELCEYYEALKEYETIISQ